MVKIEWFDLESDIVKEYLDKTTQFISEKYKQLDENDLPNDLKKAVFTNVETFLKSPRRKLLEDEFFSKYIKNIIEFPESYTEYNDKLKSVFDYEIIHKDNLRHKLLASLKVDCCPYCNRQYITSWKNSDTEEKTTADLDHFYPQNQFPLFALSLFNFVPSCQVCNSRMKHNKFIDCLYPYEESFGEDAVFRISSIDDNTEKSDKYYERLLYAFQGRENSEFSIIIENLAIDSELHQRIENSKKLFKLEEVYQAHQEYVRELLIKQRIYDEGAYLEMLNKQFSKHRLVFGDTDLKAFLYGFRWDDAGHHTRPLSKLTYDLIKQNLK